MMMSAVLTVSESKRLIAKGVVESELLQSALKNGTVAVAKGTTDSYIVEELLGEAIDKTTYCTGVTLPAVSDRKGSTSGKHPDLVLRKGERLDCTAVAAVADMGPGDVFIKGANALNYEREQAALLIGHPTGGTIGATLGTIIARRIHLVIPVGLEKSCGMDLEEAAAIGSDPDECRGQVPALWPIRGHIFTEIEAIETLAGATAVPYGAGGIGGAEGSVRLLILGNEEQVSAADELIKSIQGEPPFIA